MVEIIRFASTKIERGGLPLSPGDPSQYPYHADPQLDPECNHSASPLHRREGDRGALGSSSTGAFEVRSTGRKRRACPKSLATAYRLSDPCHASRARCFSSRCNKLSSPRKP